MASSVDLRIPSHIIVAGSSWASKLISAAVQLVSVRILLSALGLGGYSIFALLTGLQGWFLLADMGVGASVQNHMSEARARSEPVGGLLLTARLAAIALLFATIGLLYLVTPLVAPLLLKAFPGVPVSERTRLFFVTGALSIGVGIGGIVYKVWYAEQRGYLSNVVPAVASLVGLIAIAFCGRVETEWRLLYSLIAFVGPVAVLPLGILAHQLWRSRRFRPAPLRWTDICRRAIGFWVFALMAAITLQTDYIVLSQLLPGRDIATYALVTKVFGLVFFIYNALLLALWPVLTELIVKGRWHEVGVYLRRYIGIGTMFVTACTLMLLWLMPRVIEVLAPDRGIRVPAALIGVMGAYWNVRVWSDTFSVLLQSMNAIRSFFVLVPVQAILSCVLQWNLAPHFGLTGIVMALICSFLLTVVWGLPVAAIRSVRNSGAAAAV